MNVRGAGHRRFWFSFWPQARNSPSREKQKRISRSRLPGPLQAMAIMSGLSPGLAATKSLTTSSGGTLSGWFGRS